MDTRSQYTQRSTLDKGRTPEQERATRQLLPVPTITFTENQVKDILVQYVKDNIYEFYPGYKVSRSFNGNGMFCGEYKVELIK